MKQILLPGVLFFCIAFSTFSQQSGPAYQSNDALQFGDFLSGVRYAYVSVPKDLAEQIKLDPECLESQVLMGVIDYLNESGFEKTQWGTETELTEMGASLCETSLVKPSWKFENEIISEISLTYESCRHDVFQFKGNKKIPVSRKTDVRQAFHHRLKYLYGFKKASYSQEYMLQLDRVITRWTKATLKEHFLQNGSDEFEGIYESTVLNSQGSRVNFGVVRKQNIYRVVYLSGAVNYLDWSESEFKGELFPTANTKVFKAIWKNESKSSENELYITFENGMMELINSKGQKEVFIKMFPTINDRSKTVSRASVSATGFAITSDGILATNYHVIRDASQINVRGINGDFDTVYEAKVILEDKNNDLALLKIEDENFVGLNTLPYQIKAAPSEVGTSVFVLGYPLRASMGDEIKLTTGIVSSRSGYQGDVTTYQVSAAVQQGNSGGPVFDEYGNVIGVVSARHTNAENASYAVKSSYLMNLTELLGETKIPTQPCASGSEKLSSAVRKVKDFIYIIETK